MKQAQSGIKLVLVGAGQAHFEVLRNCRDSLLSKAQVALINPSPVMWYSAMVSGVVAGHFDVHEAQLNLPAFCKRQNITFIEGAMESYRDGGTGDTQREMRQIVLRSGEKISYDWTSFDLGVVPTAIDTAANATVAPIKPFDHFFPALEQAFSQLKEGRHQHWVIVGAGAAGVELALAIHHRLQVIQRRSLVSLCLIDGSSPMASHNLLVQRKIKVELAKANIRTVKRFVVKIDEKILHCSNDGESSGKSQLPYDFAIIATQGTAPAPFNFMATDEMQQGINQDHVFVVGDIAVLPKPVPKVGVMAVRQGRVLRHNLLQLVQGKQPDKPFVTQNSFLNLIALGDKRALVSHPFFYASGHWVWRLKRYIDVRYMKRLRDANL